MGWRLWLSPGPPISWLVRHPGSRLSLEASGPKRVWLGGPYSSNDPEDGKDDAKGDKAQLALHSADREAAQDEC